MIDNWESAVKKWENIIESFKVAKSKEELFDSFREALSICGFCLEFSGCPSCPLFPNICSARRRPDNLFWDIRDMCFWGKKKEAIEGAERMLAEIKKHKEKFREE